jgi:hypothetical protein
MRENWTSYNFLKNKLTMKQLNLTLKNKNRPIKRKN